MNRYLALIYPLLLLPIATPALAIPASQNSVELMTRETFQSAVDKSLDPSYLLTQSNSQDAQVHFQQGLDYWKQGKNDLALAEFNQAIQLDPTNELAYLARATVYVSQKQWKLALADFDRAIELNPQLATAYFGRSRVRIQLGDRQNAIADLNTAAQLYLQQNDTKAYQEVTAILVEEIQQLAQAVNVRIFTNKRGGSGVLIAKERQIYTVLTNAHVVNAKGTFKIQTSDGKVHQAVVKYRGDSLKGNDLALLQFTSTNNYEIAKLATDTSLTENQEVYAAGFPYDSQELTFTTGKISLVSPQPFVGGYQIGYTNEIKQGMSGGALLNGEGKLIGVNGLLKYPILNDAYTYQDGSSPNNEVRQKLRSLSFAVPIQTLAKVAPQLAVIPSKVRNNSPTTNTKGIVEQIDRIAQQITVRIDASQPENGQGSGVIFGKNGNNYYVLTNSHVVRQTDTYKIVTPDGKSYAVTDRNIIKEEGLDVAILQFSSQESYQLATLNNYQYSALNDWVFLSGFPAQAGGKHKLTPGLRWNRETGAFLRKDGSSLSDGYELVYTNLSFRGMSGGPILDVKGRVIGLGGRQEGELYSTKIDRNLGYALGVPINNCLGLIAKAKLKTGTLKVENNAPPKLTKLEERFIRNHPSFAVEIPPSNADANQWLNYGNGLWRVGRYEEAVIALNKAIELNPDLYQAYYVLGLALQDGKKYQEALTAFTEVTKLRPDYYEAWRGQSNVLFFLQKYPESLAAINQAIKYNSEAVKYGNPQDFILYVLKGNILDELGRYPELEATLNEAIKLNPNYPGAYNNRGNLYRELEKYQQAEADFNRALTLNPNLAQTYNNRGLVYTQLKKYQQAEADFNQALTLNSKIAQVYYNRGNLYRIHLKNYQQAEADYTQAIAINPELDEPYSERGFLRTELKRYQEAKVDLDRAIALDPKNSLAYIRRGLLHQILKKYQQAEADYTQAIALEPKNILAYVGRGILYKELGKYEQAEADYTQAIALEPKKSSAYYERGSVRSELKNYQGAEADFTQAIALDSKYAEAYMLRGSARLILYKDREAEADFTQAAQLFFEQGNAEKYQLAQKVLKRLRSPSK
ncbi:tetratricopeptide repeat protein [Merismopedia glauca]|uniref:Serine protease n=1 Tax=Merismopedia glauca CCAP 1448/3 TaxID=1296344 RepID=A0A2T1C253_9CYAN|nr:tetratricopeptide repeat protein [Merismopedia glauca]PSB02341.1 hypothetical protein C7B64_13690 [Merismopedia glauca CCAP 1448/3]